MVDFSSAGLSVSGLSARTGTPVAVELDLPPGPFSLCGMVVHRQGPDGAAGIRYLGLTTGQQVDLELYLWDLLAASALPSSPDRCSVAGCGRVRKARRFCSRHYNRWRREQGR